MVPNTLDNEYFEWLYRKIGSVVNRNPQRSYWQLARQLYEKPFVWSVYNDDNRAEDGKCLRDHFVLECEIQHLDENWIQMDCSVLEMLIAFSDRAAFESSSILGDWFWHFMSNLGLNQYTDAVYDEEVALEIDAALDLFMSRRYRRNGAGGLFPLQNAHRDQRKIELWSQLAEYQQERDYVDHGP